MRVFFGILLESAVRCRFVAIQQEYAALLSQEERSAWRWTAAEKLHCTLLFLGEIERTALDKCLLDVHARLASLGSFRVSFDTTGFFPSRGMPRVFWSGLQENNAYLIDCHRRLHEAAVAAGISVERRPYIPHITLARMRSRGAAGRSRTAHAQLSIEPVDMHISEISLFQSTLSSQGAVYEILEQIALG